MTQPGPCSKKQQQQKQIWNRVDCQRSEKRSKTHKRLKERFLIIRNRTKRANFRCNHLFQATHNTTENSKTNLSLSVGCQEAGGRKRLKLAEAFFFQNASSELCFRLFKMTKQYSCCNSDCRDNEVDIWKWSSLLKKKRKKEWIKLLAEAWRYRIKLVGRPSVSPAFSYAKNVWALRTA